MTNVDESAGYRNMPAHARVADMRIRLFTALRTTPRYKHLMETTEGSGEVAAQLGLVLNGNPVPWAVAMINDDKAGRYLPDQHRSSAEWEPAVRGGIVVDIDAHGIRIVAETLDASISELQPVDLVHYREHHTWINPGMTKADWKLLEDDAISLVKSLVSRLRDDYTKVSTRSKSGSSGNLQRHLERLANRLANRAGERNDPREDRRLCIELGIDVPRKHGNSRAKK
jgi:dihydroneopterin aldolase